jgi:transposase
LQKITQFNLGVFCDETSKLPLYYSRYSGSLTDRTNLPNILEDAATVGIEKIKLIMDGGFWGPEGFKALQEHTTSFTMGFPAYLEEAQKFITKHGEEVRHYTYKTSYPHIYCKEIPHTIHEIKGKVLLYFDYWGHADVRQQIDSHIARTKIELSKRKQFRQYKGDYFKEYFTLSRKDGGGVDVKVESEIVEERMKKSGYFLLFSTDMNAGPDNLLFHYRAKDAVEKLFSQIKVEMEGNRIRTHNEETTDGKTFVTFIASIIRTALHVEMSHYLSANTLSMKKAFKQLSNIEIKSTADGKIIKNALTKKQKEILGLFKITERMLKENVQNIEKL